MSSVNKRHHIMFDEQHVLQQHKLTKRKKNKQELIDPNKKNAVEANV